MRYNELISSSSGCATATFRLMPMSSSRPLRGSIPHCLLLLTLVLLSLPAFGAAAQPAAESGYQKAADACHRLEQNPHLGRRREDWLTAVQDLELICQRQPASLDAPSCLHLSGRMRRSMYQRFSQEADQKRALSLFAKVVSVFPQSPEAADAMYAIGQIEQVRGNLRTAAKIYADVVRLYPFSSQKAQAEVQLRNLRTIAESLSARKEQTAAPPPQTALQPTPSRPQPAPVIRVPVQLPAQEKNKEAAATPQAGTAGQQTAPAAAPSSNVTGLGGQRQISPPPLDPGRMKITLPEPRPPAAPATSEGQEKTAVAAPGKEKAEEESGGMFSQLKAALFGGTEEEEKKPAAPPTASLPDKAEKLPAAAPEKEAAATPAAGTPSAPREKSGQASSPAPKIVSPAAAPPKPVQNVLPPPQPAAASQPEGASQPKIVLSDLKIADLSKAQAKAEPPAPAAVPQTGPAPQPATPAKQEEKQPELVSILPVQHWASDKYSRVAVTASGPAVFHAELPAKDSGRPNRVTIEFKQSRIAAEARVPVAIQSGLLSKIRAEQADSATARVVLELKAGAECKVFNLSDPFRVVVDIRGEEQSVASAASEGQKSGPAPAAAASKPAVKPAPSTTPAADLTLAQQLGLGVRRIVIDPGHGGKDTGAAGFGLQEKDIVLKVAEKVRAILKKEHNYEVILTREGDSFLPLEERTAIANTKGADIFLSIHVNAHPKEEIKGVETFYLNLATNPEAMRVAALENATSTHSISEMQNILADLLKNTKIDESSRLAEFIQTSMVKGLGKKHQVKDLGVKQAPFYVLIGAQMPAALAEISFLTNPQEAKLLKDELYLQAVAEQIAAGVISYIEHRRTTALHL